MGTAVAIPLVFTSFTSAVKTRASIALEVSEIVTHLLIFGKTPKMRTKVKLTLMLVFMSLNLAFLALSTRIDDEDVQLYVQIAIQIF